MINKVIIAEDHQSANTSVQKTLAEMGIVDIDYVHYCDDGLVRIQKAKDAGDPYDLLITDLYFDVDHRVPKIEGGAQLIDAARLVQPEIRILVFSAEGKASVIGDLYTSKNIDGFVRKGRNDSRELAAAFLRIADNERYFPQFYLMETRRENGHDFSPYDIKIISLMVEGKRQKQIADCLEELGMKPSGISSIEKRLKLIRDALNFTNNEQLVAYCKEMGIV